MAGGLRFLEVYAGGAHSCGITTTNRAYCWGGNASGQLGDGTTTRRHQPVAVANGSFVQIRAGLKHTCAVNANNVAFCWGDNTWGQLGDNSKTRRLKPVRVAGTVHFLRLAAGAIHSCGIGTDRHGYCWGKNGHGELGDGTTATRAHGSRQLASDLGGSSLPSYAIAYLRITTDKRAFCWGDNSRGQLGTGPLSRVRSGRRAAASLRASPRLHCRRPGAAPSTASSAMASTGGSTFTTPSGVVGGLPLTWVAAGAFHTCALTDAGQAYCWGNDGWGQLGNGSTNAAELEPGGGGGAVTGRHGLGRRIRSARKRRGARVEGAGGPDDGCSRPSRAQRGICSSGFGARRADPLSLALLGMTT